MKKRFFLANLLLASAMVVATTSCSDDDSNDEPETGNIQEYPTVIIKDGVSVNGTVGTYTYVDLGLKSGVKWATYNVGATKPTEYGDHFAWGETKPKEKYSWNNYKWGTTDEAGNLDKLTKYNISGSYGTVDNKTVLESEDDAATANWGSAWRMPTLDEIKELKNGCDWELVENFNDSGVAGRVGTSKANGNTIFLPAPRLAGGVPGYVCIYWSSSLYEDFPNNAFDLNVSDVHIDWYSGTRECGRRVRAVYLN